MAKILIADDEPHIRLLLEQALEDIEAKGVTLLFAVNGQQALDLICIEQPELVFLDVMMPLMNGYDVCSKAKQECGGNTYIVLLTAKGQEQDKVKGSEVGADLYVTKPFDPDLIVAKASEILHL